MNFFYLLALFCSLNALATLEYPGRFTHQIFPTDSTSSLVNAQSFVSIPHIIVALHQMDLQKINAKVEIKTDWSSPYFSAWVKQLGANHYSMNFWGGLARIPGMNDEGHALYACHELGHILGGGPKIKLKDFQWSSAEGQSDYYATSVCLKNYMRFQHQVRPLSTPKHLSEIAYTLCRTHYSDETDFLVCLNINKGIEAFMKVQRHLNQGQNNLALDTPSTEKVLETIFDSYPDQQCRVDTLFSGSLNLPRPSCWYRSEKAH